MRYLVFSDVHSNLEALEAVLSTATGTYDRVLCCGDVVGYGPNPNEVVKRLIEARTICVRGNHDRAAAGLDEADLFNESARAAIFWTRGILTPDHRAFLRTLSKGPWMSDDHQFQLVHGSVLDEDEYLMAVEDVLQNLKTATVPMTFFGHIHFPCLFSLSPFGQLVLRICGEEALPSEVWMQLEEGTRYLINPGSVGQPRDGDPRAAFLLFDSDARAVKFRRATYDIKAVQEKMRLVRLPEFLIERLSVGE
jgi:predicted phosphodiesterase